MRQQSFSDNRFEKFRKKTRKEQFLEDDGGPYSLASTDRHY